MPCPRPRCGRERALSPRGQARRRSSQDRQAGGYRRRPRPPQPRSEPPRLDCWAAVPALAASGRAGGGRRSAARAGQDRGAARRRHWSALPVPAAAHWPRRCTIVTSSAGGRGAERDPRKSWEKLKGARGAGPGLPEALVPCEDRLPAVGSGWRATSPETGRGPCLLCPDSAKVWARA